MQIQAKTCRDAESPLTPIGQDEDGGNLDVRRQVYFSTTLGSQSVSAGI